MTTSSNTSSSTAQPAAPEPDPTTALAQRITNQTVGSINAENVAGNVNKVAGNVPLINLVPSNIRSQAIEEAMNATGANGVINNVGTTVKDNAQSAISNALSAIFSFLKPFVMAIIGVLPEPMKNALSGMMGMNPSPTSTESPPTILAQASPQTPPPPQQTTVAPPVKTPVVDKAPSKSLTP